MEVVKVSFASERWFRRKAVIFSAILFVVALGLFAFDWSYSLSDGYHNLSFIGGKATVGAVRVLTGEIPSASRCRSVSRIEL
jgi:hypothetical protein